MDKLVTETIGLLLLFAAFPLTGLGATGGRTFVWVLTSAMTCSRRSRRRAGSWAEPGARRPATCRSKGVSRTKLYANSSGAGILCKWSQIGTTTWGMPTPSASIANKGSWRVGPIRGAMVLPWAIDTENAHRTGEVA
jgi:hypothetical protein